MKDFSWFCFFFFFFFFILFLHQDACTQCFWSSDRGQEWEIKVVWPRLMVFQLSNDTVKERKKWTEKVQNVKRDVNCYKTAKFSVLEIKTTLS